MNSFLPPFELNVYMGDTHGLGGGGGRWSALLEVMLMVDDKKKVKFLKHLTNVVANWIVDSYQPITLR